MRRLSWLPTFLLAGCAGQMPLAPEGPVTAPTAQVPASPFAEPRRAAPTRVSYAPASQESSNRVLLAKDYLMSKNPKLNIKPYAIAVSANDPEIFHADNTIYITEPLIRQCGTNEALAAALAYEMGRMVAEREASVADEIRQPERPLPMHLPIGGNGNAREANPLGHIELARYEKENPKHFRRPLRPDAQNVARTLLENAGYQRTELDGVLPLLQNAERYAVLEAQFKGPQKQSEWKAP